jgi:anti-sigma regulatory factor (Ser/Thr protein kinase)
MDDNRHAACGVPPAPAGGFCHTALLFDSQEQYLAEVTRFVHTALARAEPIVIAVPAFRAGPLRQALGADAQRAVFTDMTELGRNPARIIPAITEYALDHAGTRLNCVGECTWPSRSGPELNEAIRQEALANLAMQDMPVSALCPFDVTGLPPGMLSMVEQTHPLLASRGTLCPSTAYLGTTGIPQPCLQPLPDPPAEAEVFLYEGDLRPVRALIGRHADQSGLPADRADDLVLAVSELATNTSQHTPNGGTLRIWRTPTELICQITDRGWIKDPLAGRRPALNHGDAQGLWLVNHVCDLVEQRTGPSGSTIRVHMSTGQEKPSVQHRASQ